MTVKQIQGVLIDTVSIQPYIFASSKLRENVGASFLVEDIYDTLLAKTILEEFPGQDFDLKKWKEYPDKVFKHEQNQNFDVGYIGGGNALLLFQDEGETAAEAQKNAEARAKKFIYTWTKLLLVETPGITTAVAYGEVDLDNFQQSRDNLLLLLQQNKGRYIPQTVLPRHGITAECPRSGFSRDVWDEEEKPEAEKDYISSVTNAKVKPETLKKAKAKLERIFHDTAILKQYTFTDDISKVGQRPGEDSHIAIVHIDGNGMGKRFKQAAATLEETRKLSKTVRKATEHAFRQMVITIIDNFAKIQEEVHISIDEKDNRKILPIRPIIIGGDDITFVADGKLGIYCAKIFLQEFEKQQVSDGKSLNACAGIAITRTKFPFFRGYDLAERLCKNAKRRKHEYEVQMQIKKTSWLDFHVAYGGFSGTLEDIRKEHYKHFRDKKTGSLHRGLLFRPYLLNSKEEFGLNTLIEKTRELLPPAFPKLKIIELRTALALGKEATEMFIQEQRYRNRELPRIEGKHYEDSGFVDDATPYFDMIEFMECYPEFALKDHNREVDHANTPN